MCGRYALRVLEWIDDHFQIVERPLLIPRYNIAPTQPVAVVRRQGDTPRREMRLMRWGLIPHWADDPKIGARMINARCETAAEKPAFRAAFRYRRCLIPADAFYEWQKTGRTKQPFLIERPDHGLFAFAGLWETWRDEHGNEIETVTILTTDANELLRPIHDRMPVIIPPDKYDLWLDPRTEPAQLRALLAPAPAEELTANPGAPRMDDPKQISSGLMAEQE
jgi:putative SOS response-associated peptidase YedK